VEDRSVAVQRLRQATRQIVRDLDFMRGTVLRTGCSPPEIHTLLELENGEFAVSHLAEVLRQDKSTASRNVKALVGRGLVKKVPDPADGRAHLLSLTRTGQRKAAEVNHLASAQVAAALEFLDDEERQQAIVGIELYARALERGRRLSSIEVRSIKRRDDKAMADVIRSVMTEFGAVGAGYSIEDDEVDGMYASYRPERSHYFVALQDDVLLGGAGIAPLHGAEENTCELRKMFLLPAGRGIGLGRRLAERCLEAARESGYRECYLETLRRMSQAWQLYEKLGFEPLDASMGETGHFRCDAWAIKRW
jgi:putative acetyltransferase